MTDAPGTDIIPGEPDTVAHPYAYSDLVKELAFRCWFDAGRRVAKGYRLLVEQCADAEADDALPLPSELPDESTMRRWVRRYDWHGRVAQHVADEFPAISLRQITRLIAQTDQAQEEYEAILAGERDHLSGPALNARVALITTNLQLRGLGTAGARGGEPVVSQGAKQLEDVSGLHPSERARRTREKIEAEREARRKR
jgi:hypothetical protein